MTLNYILYHSTIFFLVWLARWAWLNMAVPLLSHWVGHSCSCGQFSSACLLIVGLCLIPSLGDSSLSLVFCMWYSSLCCMFQMLCRLVTWEFLLYILCAFSLLFIALLPSGLSTLLPFFIHSCGWVYLVPFHCPSVYTNLLDLLLFSNSWPHKWLTLEEDRLTHCL